MDATSPTFTISQAARLLGVSADWLREGEKRGSLPTARRDFYTNRRIYTERDLDELRTLGVGSHPRRLRGPRGVLTR